MWLNAATSQSSNKDLMNVLLPTGLPQIAKPGNQSEISSTINLPVKKVLVVNNKCSRNADNSGRCSVEGIKVPKKGLDEDSSQSPRHSDNQTESMQAFQDAQALLML